jgi:protein-S-isoprenylcysteine O-methyltransferase Ste14
MKRYAVLLFGTATYIMFLGVFLYAVGFVGNFLVPTTLDGTPTSPTGQALVINLMLLGLFAIQHSVMARPWFKKMWTRIVPEPVERSVYVLATNLVLCLLFWQWRPMGGVVWDVQNTAGQIALYGVFAFGWLTVLVTTCLINHFDLFGLRQVWLYFKGREYTPVGFTAPGPYKHVRHPMYIGWMAAFWGTPTMTSAHLAFAIVTTVYILTAIYFEERDLMTSLGENYVRYREQVPKLIPRLFSHSGFQPTTETHQVSLATAESLDSQQRNPVTTESSTSL